MDFAENPTRRDFKKKYWPSEVEKPDKWIIVMCDYNSFTHRQ